MEKDEGSDKKIRHLVLWMAAHARLKNEFSGDEKYHNLMTWLKCQTDQFLEEISIGTLVHVPIEIHCYEYVYLFLELKLSLSSRL